MRKYVSNETLKKKNKKNKRKRVLTYLSFILLIGAVTFVAVEFYLNKENDVPVEPAPTPTAKIASILKTNTSIDLLLEEDVSSVNKSYHSFTSKMVQVQESDLVPLTYFDDALFVGDSLADGFNVYRNQIEIPNSSFVTAKSTSPKSYLDGGYITFTDGLTKEQERFVGFEGIASKNAGKIYITMGTNALHSSITDDEFMATYSQFIDELRAYLPETQIYITSVLPVALSDLNSYPGLAPERVQIINERIAQMCYEKDLAYLNIYDVLTDDAGYLRADIAQKDGIHVTIPGYSEWINYLRTHTVYNTSNSALIPAE